MSETKKIDMTPEQAQKALLEGKLKIGKADVTIDSNSAEGRQLVREILKHKEEGFGASNLQPLPETQKVQELAEENEDLKNKLAIVAEKAFERKRKEANEIDTPEKLLGFVKAKESMQPREEHGGVAPLNSYQYNGGQQQATDLMHRKFANIEEAIATLQNERRNGGAQAVEADRLLNLLWKKGLGAWREAGHPSQTYSPDSNMEKSNAVPDINFENPKVSEESGFPQIKKSPYGYSKSHTASGQKKE
jgi:hypothetical protein